MAVDLRAPANFFSGSRTRWGINQFVFNAQGTQLDHTLDAQEDDGTGFGATFKNAKPGIRDGKLKISGWASLNRNEVTDIFDDYQGQQAEVYAWYALQGTSFGAPCRIQPSSVIKHTIKSATKDSVKFDAELTARGRSNKGIILVSPNSLVSGSSWTSPIDDNILKGGDTIYGGAIQYHLIALNGGTNPTVSIQLMHAPVSSSSFTNVTGASWSSINAVGAGHIDMPTTVTIQDQTQVQVTTTGSPTEVQLLVVLGRGQNPDA